MRKLSGWGRERREGGGTWGVGGGGLIASFSQLILSTSSLLLPPPSYHPYTILYYRPIHPHLGLVQQEHSACRSVIG